jgi:hypothetical protein
MHIRTPDVYVRERCSNVPGAGQLAAASDVRKSWAPVTSARSAAGHNGDVAVAVASGLGPDVLAALRI